MMHYLDEPVLIEILARVPVKSLLRFKCVSRQWRDLISDPGFVKAQLMRLREDPNPPQRLVVEYGHGTRNYASLDIAHVTKLSGGEELQGTAFTRLDLGPPPARVVTSCHGLLVCLLAADDSAGPPRLSLYNPATGERRRLPTPHLSYEGRSTACIFGFGYDTLNDDYKLIVGTGDPCGTISKTFDIFSLRSNTWRRIGTLSYRFQPLETIGMYSNGFLHWPLDLIVSLQPFQCRRSMLSFDVSKEEFHQGLLPVPSFTEHEGGTQLGVTGGGWLIAQRSTPPNTSEVWFMKDYSGPDSTWTKLCYLPGRPWSLNAMFPWIRDGKIILCTDSGLDWIGIYDPEDDSEVAAEVPMAYSGLFSIITSYVESLVSPHV